MPWPFRRRRSSDLGAAVTGIPSLAPARVVPASYGAFAHPPDPAAAVAAVAAPAAVAPVAPSVPEALPGPRVELGFRDGTALALAPGSEQAKALTDIAQVLTQRD